jgi:hypothetical protein
VVPEPLKKLTRMVTNSFYEPLFVVVVEYLLQHQCACEEDIITGTGLNKTLVRGCSPMPPRAAIGLHTYIPPGGAGSNASAEGEAAAFPLALAAWRIPRRARRQAGSVLVHRL